MSRIKINDLPQNATISQEEMKRLRGGIILSSSLTSLDISYKILSPSANFYINPDSFSTFKE